MEEEQLVAPWKRGWTSSPHPPSDEDGNDPRAENPGAPAQLMKVSRGQNDATTGGDVTAAVSFSWGFWSQRSTERHTPVCVIAFGMKFHIERCIT